MLDLLNDLIWSKLLIVMLIGLGLLFTIRSGFVQFRYFGNMFTIFGHAFERQPGQLSSFQALMLSVAGRVGAGNIAGVSVAIMLGGPGAIFWMWVVALVGMATSYFECSLAQLYKRREPDGTYRDGVEDTVHMALTRGEISPEEPTLVRVHNMEPLRDLLLVTVPGRWSLRAAMSEVATAGKGVVLLLGNPLTGPQLLSQLNRQQPPTPATYSTVGAGSQILRDLGVRKMRLMSAPMKFNAISGFDLEVVEYLPAE